MISANRTNKRMEWALDRFRQRVRMKLKAVMHDGYLPMTEKPAGELEEIERLEQRLPQLQMMVSLPPDPAVEAMRSQAQLDIQRYIYLAQKLRGEGDAGYQ